MTEDFLTRIEELKAEHFQDKEGLKNSFALWLDNIELRGMKEMLAQVIKDVDELKQERVVTDPKYLNTHPVINYWELKQKLASYMEALK